VLNGSYDDVLLRWRAELPPPPAGKTVTQRVRLFEGFDTGCFRDDREAQGPKMVGFHISGPCPVCAHETRAVCATRYLALKTGEPDPAGYDRYQITALRCACVDDHTSQMPPGPVTFGCGAEWLLKVSWSTRDPMLRVKKEIVGAPDDEVWAVVDANDQAIPATLTNYQAVAGKWQAALTAIIALVSVASILTGRDTFRTLAAPWKAGLIVALAVAIIGNGLVLWSSDLASLGWPTVKNVEGTPKRLADADLEPLRRAQTAQAEMVRSGLLVIPTLLGAIVAISILLLVGPTPPTPTYKVTVAWSATQSATTPCGHFTGYVPYTAAVPKKLTFTPAIPGGRPLTIDGTKVTAIAPC
jgi:hypothetical protein